MATIDRPARHITRLTELLAAREADVAAALARVAQLETAIETAAELWRQAVHKVVDLEALLRVAAQQRTEAAEVYRAEFTQMAADKDAVIAELRARLVQADERAVLLDQREAELHAVHEANRAELTALVDRVAERMRAREREEAQALLNRRALSGAVPGKNRR
jgi:chromosome segregation ATPase